MSACSKDSFIVFPLTDGHHKQFAVLSHQAALPTTPFEG